MAAVELRDIRKSFGKTEVLRNVSLAAVVLAGMFGVSVWMYALSEGHRKEARAVQRSQLTHHFRRGSRPCRAAAYLS